MRVLLVEDHPDVAEMTLEVLKRMGLEAEWAATGACAITIACRSAPDLILIDLNLPDMSGLEVARQLRAEGGGEATLIALSGLSDSVDRERALAVGFDAFFTKPMDFGLLPSIHATASAAVGVAPMITGESPR